MKPLCVFMCVFMCAGEEENVVSQKQRRQQWFQEVEECSKSGDWDSGDGECVISEVVTYL